MPLPIILSGNVASATASTDIVSNSCRFNDDDNAYMGKTSGSNGTSTSGTFSCWVKRGNLGVTSSIMSQVEDSNNFLILRFTSGDALDLRWSDAGSGTDANLTTNRVFRDCSAWYNIVVKFLTSDGTGSNRVKIYINGVQETSFSSSDYPTQNDPLYGNVSSGVYRIGDNGFAATGEDFDGYMAEVVWLDGTSTTASDFGEFDEDSPTIWKPKDVSGLTFGTNGFYLDFEDSSNLGNDANGGTDLTETNLAATDQATDTPTNNFATLNPLFPSAGTTAFSEGNLKLVASGSAGSGISSIGVSTSKWYMEVKQTAVNEPLGNGESGIAVVGDPTGNLGNVEGTAFAYGIRNYNGTKFENTSSGSSWHANWTAGDIIGVALDMDNHRVYFSKNGQWSDGSGNFDESTPNAYLSLSTAKTNYFLAMSQLHSSATETYEVNFGNPTFSISSSNSDANGYGNFEYAPPSGYLALCTKNLGSDGG